MKNNPNSVFLRRTLSRLLPDAFFHPLWTHCVSNSANYSSDFIRHLLQNLLLEQFEEDLVGNCQCIFLCAYLQSRLGEHAAALASINQAWKLAETHSLHQISCCAAWGACAICVRWGNYQGALDWLSKLQEKLKETHEWILLNILELFRELLEAPVSSSGGELLGWLLHWGEWPLAETPNRPGAEKPQHVVIPAAGIISRVSGLWSSFWNSVKFEGRGGTRRQWSPPRDELTPGDQAQVRESSSNPRGSLSDSRSLSARDVSFSQNNQMTSEVSGSTAPLFESHTTPPSLVSLSPPKQPGLPSLAVYCLGQFRVYQDEQLINTWPSGKGKTIFKYMIANFGRPIPRDVLMDLFWREADLEAARRNLHQAIYSLRLTLKGGYSDYQYIRFENESYSLNPDMLIWIDYQEFEKHARAGRRLEPTKRLEEAMAEYGIAEALYQGDFLEEDLYEDWPNSQRDHFRSIDLDIADRLVSYYIKRGEYSPAIALCQKTLAKDDCHESAHRSLIQCYTAQGQRHLAVRQYHACVEALKNGLNLEPSRETTSLYHRIRSAP